MRGAAAGRRSPGPFHCLACRTYVTGTPSGHCPRCGWVPPEAPVVAGEPPRPIAWPLAAVLLVLVALAILFAG